LTTDHFTETERRVTIAGVLVVFLLSALDQTIIATAMPKMKESCTSSILLTNCSAISTLKWIVF